MEKWEKVLIYSDVYNAEIYNFELDEYRIITVNAISEMDAYSQIMEQLNEDEDIYNIW